VRGVRQRRAGRQWAFKGTGSLAASSFLNFGKDDTKSPQRGDIASSSRRRSPSGEHVGFVDSVDKAGNVKVLGGNTSDKVGQPPIRKGGAGDQATADAVGIGRRRRQGRQRRRAAKRCAQDTFDSERAR
jgi:hypothetical protein